MLSTFAAMIAPCSVKAKGRYRSLRFDAVTICDRMASTSSEVASFSAIFWGGRANPPEIPAPIVYQPGRRPLKAESRVRFPGGALSSPPRPQLRCFLASVLRKLIADS